MVTQEQLTLKQDLRFRFGPRKDTVNRVKSYECVLHSNIFQV